MACASCGKRYGASRQMRAAQQRAQLATRSQVRSALKASTEPVKLNETNSGDLTAAIKASTEDTPTE